VGDFLKRPFFLEHEHRDELVDHPGLEESQAGLFKKWKIPLHAFDG
jgi:hypothetical protein